MGNFMFYEKWFSFRTKLASSKEVGLKNIEQPILKKVQPMTQLEEYLSYYVGLEAPNFAVLVTGDWGTGKTHQVKKIVPEGNRLYVSLFGVQTVDQLDAEVFAASFPTFDKIDKTVRQGGDAAANAGGLWALAGLAPNLLGAVFKRDIKPDKILIFDDLERSNLQLKDILGSINQYVEHRGFRVIVIAHDTKLADEFLQVKEKTFGQTILAEPQTEEAIDHFFEKIGNDSAKSFLVSHRSEVLDVFQQSKISSLRILRHIVDDIARLHSMMSDDHLRNSDAMSELVKTFVAFSAEVRSASLAKIDLVNRNGVYASYLMRGYAEKDKVIDAPALVKANEKYPTINLEGGMLNDDVLVMMLIEGRYSTLEIRKSLDNSVYFIDPVTVRPWKIVIHFDELDDEIVEEALKKMEQQFINREITESGEILHVCALRMVIAEQKSSEKSIENTYTECKDYITDLLNLDKLPPRGPDWLWYEEFNTAYDGFGYWITDANSKFFKSIWDHLIESREESFRRKFPEILNDLMRMVRDDSNEFFEAVSPTNNGPNPFAHIPLLHGIPAKDFVDAWLGSPHANWRKVHYGLENRYQGSQLYNSLKEEKDWALQVLEVIDQKADAASGFGALRIRRIRPKVLLELRQNESTQSQKPNDEG